MRTFCVLYCCTVIIQISSFDFDGHNFSFFIISNFLMGGAVQPLLPPPSCIKNEGSFLKKKHYGIIYFFDLTKFPFF
jgi:hypothetical protein